MAVQHGVGLVVVDERSFAGSQRSFRRSLTAICWRWHRVSVRTAMSIGAAGLVRPLTASMKLAWWLSLLKRWTSLGPIFALRSDFGIGVDHPAVHVDPALAAEEQHAVAVAATCRGCFLAVPSSMWTSVTPLA